MAEKIICDTNVWYGIELGIFKPSHELSLIPTSLSLFEIASTDKTAKDPKLVQGAIRAINTYGKQIIPINPYDFVIHNHDSEYYGDASLTYKILDEFSKFLNLEMPGDFKVDENIQKNINLTSKSSREASKIFANSANEELPKIRKKIIETTGKKAHLKIDNSEGIKEMLKSFFNDYLKDKKYAIDYDKFNWTDIELFLAVTENFFKHLETTKGMKIDENDPIDWLNMLYVRPGDKYLTFEKSWKRYILEDKRIAHYLYTM